MTLSSDRLERFARHIVLPELGGAGQVALAEAHVAVIGCGGIGSPAIQYLAAAGIGRLTLVDDDTVDLSNLQRQTIFAPGDVGMSKAEVAAQWVHRFDPAIEVHAIAERIDRGNAASIISGSDLVLDGCDNFATRLSVSDAGVKLGIPLTSAALGRFQGQIANFAGHLPGEACYRCFVGDAIDGEDCDTCAADGVLGAMAGTVGCFAAMHAIRVLIAGKAAFGDPQWGMLHLLDGMSPSLRALRIVKDAQCKGCAV
jgi:molybdopterin/thiamine biosynthesis adenylyltransferase